MRAELSIRGKAGAWSCGAILALALGLSAWAGGATNDEATGPEMTDFKAQLENFDPPNEKQIKTLLEGNRAQPRSGEIWITEARLKTFHTNGTLDVIATAPRCVYDSSEKTVHSSGSLQVHSADERFFLEGEGFLLHQTNSTLIISNQVHTIIRNAPGKPPSP